MKILENKINGETCIKQIRTMLSVTVTEEEFRCRNCNGEKYKCPDYRAVKLFEIPLNYVRLK